MTDLVSRVYQPDPEKCCESCVFGRGDHAVWCVVHSREMLTREIQWLEQAREELLKHGR